MEIIQTEGFDATKQIDPNMVLKKKNGKDEEVQDGYVGHVIPFNLIQSTILKEEVTSLVNKNNALTDIINSYEEIIENISEDDKESYKDLFNEDSSAFVNSEVAKTAKALNKTKAIYGEDTVEYQIIMVSNLIEKEKALKKEIKTETENLLAKTKTTIENLTNEQVVELLKEKWINPLILALNQLPNLIVKDLVSKISYLANKYSLTLIDLESQIKEAEKALISLIDELDGDEYDMKGLEALKTLLGGGLYDKK